MTEAPVSESSPVVGAQFTLSATVRNAGAAPAPATTLRYYRSTDATITTSDTEVGTAAVAGLGASADSSAAVPMTAPSTAGMYYYGACVDAVADESDTTNNCSAAGHVRVLQLGESDPTVQTQTNPDLVVQSPSVNDDSPTTGATFTLSATVRNGGDGASAATTLRYYQSTDATITSSDTSLGTDAVEALAAGADGDESISLTASSTAGTYYYGACVDAVADESNTTNNCSPSVEVTVLTTQPQMQVNPDLVVGSPSVNDNSPETGAAFTLSATVRNDGEGAAAATTLRYYRSSDGTITTSDTSVGTDAVGGLAASATSSESISLTAPSTAGTYYYGACVDAVADESDTTNNCSPSVEVDVTEPPPQTNPDLVLAILSVDESNPATGALLTLWATVWNAGDVESPATTLRYYRSTDATITTGDTSMGTDPVGALAADDDSDEQFSLTAPSTAGTYYYGACVDAVAGESDTTNNCSESVRVTVGALPPPAPDLFVHGASVSDSVEPGGTFWILVTVQNLGDGQSATTTVRFYRSTDGTITTSDTQVGTEPVRELGNFQNSANLIPLTAPSTAGTYYYGACVDAVAGESDTTNNCSRSAALTVTDAEQ